MDPETLQTFCAKAEVDLAGIRNGILIFVQDRRSVSDLDIPIRTLNALRLSARAVGMSDIEGLASECELNIEELGTNDIAAAENASRRILDLLARIEASLLRIQLTGTDFLTDISDFVDESFEHLTHRHANVGDQNEPEAKVEFEIDEESEQALNSLVESFEGDRNAALKSLQSARLPAPTTIEKTCGKRRRRASALVTCGTMMAVASISKGFT